MILTLSAKPVMQLQPVTDRAQHSPARSSSVAVLTAVAAAPVLTTSTESVL